MVALCHGRRHVGAHGVTDGHYALECHGVVVHLAGEGQRAHGLPLIAGQCLLGAHALFGIDGTHVEYHLGCALHESHVFVAHGDGGLHVFLLGAERLLADDGIVAAQGGIVVAVVAKPQEQRTLGGVAYHGIAVELGGGVDGHGHS